MTDLKWPRVLIKLSGEAFAGDLDGGIDLSVFAATAKYIAEAAEAGVEICIVIGGGNFIRGQELAEEGIDRPTADAMGMLGTLINALAFQAALEKCGVDARTLSAVEVSKFAEPYIRRRAIRHLEKGRVVVFAAGTGNPYFTTDTAALLRAAEIEAKVVLMAKNGVEGVYDSDPKINPDAVHLTKLRTHEVIERNLRVADLTSMTFAKDNGLPIIVFNCDDPRNITRILLEGDGLGTLVTP